ncbi:MAG: hypothetical protein AAF958_01005 [Planctomycetota bacterium]
MKTLRRILLVPVVAIALALSADTQTADADNFALSVGGGRGLSIATGGFYGPSFYRGYRGGFGPGFGYGHSRFGVPPVSISRGYRGFGPTFYPRQFSASRYRSLYVPAYRPGCRTPFGF